MVYTLVVHLRAKKDSIPQVNAKLAEASSIYSQDKETVSWLIMQSVHDPQDFTIVERYKNEASQKYHLENPYWKTFDPFVIPLLEKPMDLRRYEELDADTKSGMDLGTSQEVLDSTAEYQAKNRDS